MKSNIGALLLAIMTLSSINCYVDLKNNHEHFDNVHSNYYVLSVFYNPKRNYRLTKPLTNVLDVLDKSEVIKSNGVVVEYIDISQIPFFDNHYDLEGKNSINLFIRNQMVIMDNFEDYLELMYKRSTPEHQLASKIEAFLAIQLNKISTEIRDISHFREAVLVNRIIGFYSGSKSANFVKYMHMARKNIDFNFYHTFDPVLRETIFNEFAQIPAPQGNSFAITRYGEDLNDFDNQMVTVFNDFSEKALTEFFEYERFDKLRGPEQGNEIVKRMFFKSQPLLLYVQGSSKDSQKFEIFKEAVKSLPKSFIYSYTDLDSTTSGAYLQLFMLASAIMAPDTVSIIWVAPSRAVRVEPFQNEFSKNSIVSFVFDFYEQHKQILESMKSHLYEKEAEPQEAAVSSDEL